MGGGKKNMAPIVSSYNDQIRPLLDTVDKLRSLNVMKEGIQLPTIVVVGDQSSGKSSVLESLTGISLPHGQGLCTRVPLVMRLQQSSSSEPQIWLEYNDKVVHTDEENIDKAICAATNDITGSGKGVSDTPLTLHVKKADIPDLTMVDLPGITWVPVNGQPEDIYEQISRMIMKYIQPQESIILNVLSATVDFRMCESIRMSRQVDPAGERTLAVVTKADIAPEGLLQKVTSNDVSIGLGYVCVRNRIGDETYQKARKEEELLFRTHPLLSMIDKDIVGIPVLAHKLIQIQATMITGSAKEYLFKILVQGDFSEYPVDHTMHCTGRLPDMLNQFSNDLQEKPKKATEFLMDEIKILEQCRRIGLPDFLPKSAFMGILSRHVDAIHTKLVKFIRDVWDYIEVVLSSVTTKYSENFPQIQSSIKQARRNLICKMKEQSVNRVTEIVEMEKLTAYTCKPEYMTKWTKKIASQQSFVNSVYSTEYFSLNGTENVKVSHLRKYDTYLLQHAFDLKMRMSSYWPIALHRIVDSLVLHLHFSVKNLVNKEFQEMAAEIMDSRSGSGGRIKRLREESPSVASKREKLNNGTRLSKESKDTVTSRS